MRRQETSAALRYRIYGLTLSSDVPLPELASGAAAAPDVEPDARVRLEGPYEDHPVPSEWFLSCRGSTGPTWLSAARVAGGYYLRFPKLADFILDADGRRITCVRSDGASAETRRHLLLDQVLPLAVTLHGRQALHATAVITPAGVCAFAGPSGVGKSTLAASFVSGGCPVISDDCLVLEPNRGGVLARPAYPGVRLLTDALDALGVDKSTTVPMAHYPSKRRALGGEPAAGFAEEAFPLVRIFLLSRQDCGAAGAPGPTIQPLSQPAAFLELLSCTFTLETSDQAFLQRQFDWVGRIIDAVPLRRLHVPHGFASLTAVRTTILSDLGIR